MKFRLLERALLLGLLPSKGKFEDLIIAEDVKDKVKFTQEDIKEYNIVTTASGVTWKEEFSSLVFEYEFTGAEFNLILKQLKELDNSKALTPQHLDLYKMFAHQ